MIVALALTVCATSTRADIVVGLSMALTGSNAAVGVSAQRGFEQAVADINRASGGVLGHKVIADVGDSACVPLQAVSVANRFVKDGVAAVIGPMCSGSAMAAAQTYHDGKVLVITPSSTLLALTQRGMNNIFRTIATDAQQAQVAGRYIVDHFKAARIAFIHDKQSYGKGLADGIKAVVNAAGVKEAMYESINPGEKDYSALITKMKSKRIDFVFYGGYYQEAGLITRQMREQGLKTQLMGPEGCGVDGYWGITGAAGEGTIITAPPDFSRREAAQKVLEEFQARSFSPGIFSWTTYAAVQVWAQAAEKAHSLALQDILPVLHSTTFKTVIGNFGYDAKGDMSGGGGYVVHRWTHGVLEEVR